MRRYDVMFEAITEVVHPHDLARVLSQRDDHRDVHQLAEALLGHDRHGVTVTKPERELTADTARIIGFTPDDGGRTSMVTWPDLIASLRDAATPERIEALRSAAAEITWPTRLGDNVEALRASIRDIATAAADAAGLQRSWPQPGDTRDVSLHDRGGPIGVMCDGYELAQIRPSAFGRVAIDVSAQHAQGINGRCCRLSLDETNSTPALRLEQTATAGDHDWTVTADERPVLRIGESGRSSIRLDVLDANTGEREWGSDLTMPGRPPRCVGAAVNRLTHGSPIQATGNGRSR